jgi:ferrous iron transport protein B
LTSGRSRVIWAFRSCRWQARRGAGRQELLGAIEMVASGQFSARPHRIKYIDEKLETAVETLAEQLRGEFDDLPNARWVALRLLEGDENIINAGRKPERLGRLKKPELSHRSSNRGEKSG